MKKLFKLFLCLSLLLIVLALPFTGYQSLMSDSGKFLSSAGASSAIIPYLLSYSEAREAFKEKLKTPPPKEPPVTPESPPEPPPKENPSPTAPTLDNEKLSWYFLKRGPGLVPNCPPEAKDLLKKYTAFYTGDTSEKIIYLTMDEGYENGYTPAILDNLKVNAVKVSFFITEHYLKSRPDLVKRMLEEGHLVLNHSVSHADGPDLTDDEFNNEIAGLASLYKEMTGMEMLRYYRPPSGYYSERTLYLSKKLGYKTIFWSFAYRDWEVDNQPSLASARKAILEGAHPGAIMLLHAVSKTNMELLDEVLKELKSQGYEFKLLTELP
ncbi:MAG: delta-lactam-biosynthetic de-N-acetylase [Bacillota bacterium]|nr:delta-lactam-biosynthetic de-N-acetylase [Bacillota bacterium]